MYFKNYVFLTITQKFSADNLEYTLNKIIKAVLSIINIWYSFNKELCYLNFGGEEKLFSLYPLDSIAEACKSN